MGSQTGTLGPKTRCAKTWCKNVQIVQKTLSGNGKVLARFDFACYMFAPKRVFTVLSKLSKPEKRGKNRLKSMIFGPPFWWSRSGTHRSRPWVRGDGTSCRSKAPYEEILVRIWDKRYLCTRPTKGLKRAQKGCSKWVLKMVHFGPPKITVLGPVFDHFWGSVLV